MELEKLVRKNILNLKPYTSARDKYQDGILLDADVYGFKLSMFFLTSSI